MLMILVSSAPARAVTGIDVRASNPTCLAHPRPGIGSDVAIATQPMFPYLTLSTGSEWTLESLRASPMVLRQSPARAGVWYLAERDGLILRLDDGTQRSAPFLDIQSKVQADYLDPNDEGGLLGLALDPNFASNGQLYVFYTGAPVPPGSEAISILSRFRSTNGGLTVDPTSETILLTIPQATNHHHAGALEFGPDGMLYVGVGDSGSPQDAQDRNSRLGSILRIDVHAGSPYAIPSDNPAAGGGAPEVWAKGLRNPYRFTFDAKTGQLFAGDVGQAMWEEVDLITRGGNYGWPIREGAACYDQCCTYPNSPECTATGLIDPVYAYPHAGGGACEAIIGGYVYRGSIFPEIRGVYVFSDWCSADLRMLTWNVGVGVGAEKIYQAAGLFRSLATDSAGEMYLLRTGLVEKLVRSTTPPPAPFPQHLSETGCVQAADATQPAAGVIPYGVDAPLWSDGAAKRRWIGLPDGQRISVLPDGDWSFPIGSVLMKRFELRGKPIETRLFMRHDDGGWAGYTYEWNDAGTDADLLSGAKTKQIGDQTWLYPSRDQCMSCHTEIAGFTLGPMTAQLNFSFYYPGSGRSANQLETLEHIGVLDGTPDSRQRITTAGSDSIDLLARSYLQANCAHCHAPGSPVQASIDLRFSTPLDQMNVCGATPTQGNLGVAGARIVVPGDPSRSILSLRMRDLGANRMPPLATNRVDAVGTTIVDTWIRALEAAPDGSCRPRPVPACSNGSDDDGDGFVDFPDDPGCADPGGAREDPACNNGIDDDGDGRVDFDGGAVANHGVPIGPPDPGCVAGYSKSEKRGCGLGAELLVALALLARLRRRS
jgi:uncharacterized repeat protein (TIGR03806 family)